MRRIGTGLTAFAALATAALGVPSSAGAASLEADYAISLAGLPLGDADVKSSFDGTRYRLDLQARLTGIAGLFTGGGGGAGAATGVVSGSRPTPSTFMIASHSGGEQRTVRMSMAAGNVAAVSLNPPLDDKPDRVPLLEAHKRGVIDPVSALVMPAVTRGPVLDPGNCNRTIPIFDGAARFDVVLSYGGTKTVQKPGYSGPVLVCNARYIPIAGHRAHRPATAFMQNNREMSVWLVPVESVRLLVPIRIAVRTMIGTTVIEATRWTMDGAQPAPASQALRNPKIQ
jgi:uncharacterized protein DUF3108